MEVLNSIADLITNWMRTLSRKNLKSIDKSLDGLSTLPKIRAALQILYLDKTLAPVIQDNMPVILERLHGEFTQEELDQTSKTLTQKFSNIIDDKIAEDPALDRRSAIAALGGASNI